jgi:hypothetical protein
LPENIAQRAQRNILPGMLDCDDPTGAGVEKFLMTAFAMLQTETVRLEPFDDFATIHVCNFTQHQGFGKGNLPFSFPSLCWCNEGSP